MFRFLKKDSSALGHDHKRNPAAFLKYIGPGLLVTVGFIDPGNWASNIAAGSSYGYTLLWMVTLSTIMLIILQHNAAHLGIATGDCLSEAAAKHLKPWLSMGILSTAVIASVSTALAEILGAALALNLLLKIPVEIGAVIALVTVLILLFTNSYKRVEKIIIGFVSLIGLSFLYEIIVVNIDWARAAVSWLTPSFPAGSMPIIMAVLGAVVMPHNLFLHSEVIQSRQWNLTDDKTIRKQLRYEFLDTLFSMIVGWAINSAMILVAASVFFTNKVNVTDIGQAQTMLTPLLGGAAAVVFALALLFSGLSSTLTAGMAGGSIIMGMYKKPYDIKDKRTKIGVAGILTLATIVIFLLPDKFSALVYSQMLLSIQLPITIFLQIYLTSSAKVMGKYKNTLLGNITLWTVAAVVTGLNIYLLISTFI